MPPDNAGKFKAWLQQQKPSCELVGTQWSGFQTEGPPENDGFQGSMMFMFSAGAFTGCLSMGKTRVGWCQKKANRGQLLVLVASGEEPVIPRVCV